MKNLLAWLLLALALTTAHAQVTVEVSLDQDNFLSGEAVPVAVSIVNRSGQNLRFGQDQTWVTFSVESRDGGVVSRIGYPDVAGEFVLESSKRATKYVDIVPCFNLAKLGSYTVTATVTIKDWNQQITSKPVGFSVITGVQLWEREFGVPRPSGASNRPPELRRYSLHQANYLRSQLMLYIQVSDRTGKLNRVFPVGPMLSFGQPEPQVDRLSNLHVLYQNGPRTSTYVLVDPNGDVIRRETYDFKGSSRPRLLPDADGNLQIVGGVRRIMRDDVSPIKLSNDNAQTSRP